MVNVNIILELIKWLKLKFNIKFMYLDNRIFFNNEDLKIGFDGGLSEGFYYSLVCFCFMVLVIDFNGYFMELFMIFYLQSGMYIDM